MLSQLLSDVVEILYCVKSAMFFSSPIKTTGARNEALKKDNCHHGKDTVTVSIVRKSTVIVATCYSLNGCKIK